MVYSEPLLWARNLRVDFQTYAGAVHAVRGINFDVAHGETVGIVGESGCGKSASMLAVTGLLPRETLVSHDTLRFEGQDLGIVSNRQLQRIRGTRLAMIFQDPMTSLNPVLSIGIQLTEHVVKHQGLTKKEARAKAVEVLDLVGIPNAIERLKQYPHEFSGGMRQRVMIAIALIREPSLLIADEPTTALDVTIQAQILDLLANLKERFSMSVILITHDLGVVATMCDRLLVMYAGEIVEEGTVNDVFYDPAHPYTKALLASVPDPEETEHQRLLPVQGQPPDLMAHLPGCPFASRCDYAMYACLDHRPERISLSESHHVACWGYHPASNGLQRRGA